MGRARGRKYEMSINKISVGTFLQIAEYFDTPLEYFISDGEI
ncbi:MAG: hypothetical protein ACI9CD_001263 [Candidatus Deianiraeaceae bacterium]|jgi:hypothetical protein